MKRTFTFLAIVIMTLAVLTGCEETEANRQELERQCESLRAELDALSEQKETLQNEIIAVKEENGTAKYVITFRINQTHFTLDLGEHLKDSLNEITIEIPVDKEYYDSVSIGDVVNDDFRMGSLIMHGSYGNWNVIIEGKEIR